MPRLRPGHGDDETPRPGSPFATPPSIAAAHDMIADASTKFSDIPDLNARAYQIDVLGEYRDAWRFLREESPAYPDDEFQIDDLNDMAVTRDLLITLDFAPDNINGILAALPEIRGIALPLSESAARNDLHRFTFDEAAAVLRAVVPRPT